MTYEMLSGHLPFDGESAVEILTKHCTADAPPLEMLVPALPRAVTAVVQRGMAKEAGDRFISTVAFVRALRDAVEGRSVSGPTPARAPRPRKGSPKTPAATSGRGGRWRVGIGLTVIAAGGCWLAYQTFGQGLDLRAILGIAASPDSITPAVPSARLHFTTRPRDAQVHVADSSVRGDSITLPLGSASDSGVRAWLPRYGLRHRIGPCRRDEGSHRSASAGAETRPEGHHASCSTTAHHRHHHR